MTRHAMIERAMRGSPEAIALIPGRRRRIRMMHDASNRTGEQGIWMFGLNAVDTRDAVMI